MDKLWDIRVEMTEIELGDELTSDQGQKRDGVFYCSLKTHGVNISMDGKGRALDNVITERFWRSLKYERIFLHEYDSMQELFDAVKRFIEHYNSKRYHQSLDYKTPNQVWQENHVT